MLVLRLKLWTGFGIVCEGECFSKINKILISFIATRLFWQARRTKLVSSIPFFLPLIKSSSISYIKDDGRSKEIWKCIFYTTSHEVCRLWCQIVKYQLVHSHSCLALDNFLNFICLSFSIFQMRISIGCISLSYFLSFFFFFSRQSDRERRRHTEVGIYHAGSSLKHLQ